MMDSRQHALVAPLYYSPHHPPPLYHDPAFASLLAQRAPLQLPLGGLPAADPLHHQQQHHQHHQHNQLSLAAPGFHYPNFRPQQQLPLRHRHQSYPARAVMAHQQGQPQGMSEEEMAELQKASNEYQPDAVGPLVGERQPSTAITTEYASADPVFQAKTAALPQKYSHYRTVRGDGACGWRATAFGYFETLVHTGDVNKFYEELARLRSLSNVCSNAGYESYLYEDFAEETYDLLARVRDALSTGNAEDVLMEAFNDESIQNYIITHLKTLTSAWMKTHPNDYAPYLVTQSVEEYTNAQVMPVAAEIDHLGLSALKDVFLSPAGITLEVLYLDRSDGEEVNLHRMSPRSQGVYDAGTIRLLYRPGHYDLLYDLPPVSIPTTVPTYLQYASHPHQEPVYDLGVSDFMTMIPGMSYANPQQSWTSGSGYAGSDFFGPPAPVQQCTQALATPAAPAPQPQIQPQPAYAATPTQLVPPPTQFPQELAIRTAPHASTMQNVASFQHQAVGPFRPSAWELEPDFMQTTPLQTSIMRNSHLNIAHFMNPEFQPEEWRPDNEYVTPSSKSSRLRSSG